MSQLCVVMYHYVRERSRTRFPRIPARELSEFRGQLDYLIRHFEIVSLERCLSGDLPERAALLTFDDGYRDHFENVHPLLVERALPAVAFPPARAVLQRELLDVHKIQAVIASVSEVELATSLVGWLRELEAEFPGCAARMQALRPPAQVRFDAGGVAWVKRVLQKGEPKELRELLVAKCFARFVGIDPKRLAEETYVTVDELRAMRLAGWEIGGHGWDHPWWDSLDAARQAREIEASLELLEAVGGARERWSFAYPYGSFTDESEKLLAAHGCAFAFTTEPRVADLARDSRLKLPRLDTNDFPVTAVE